ncbi:MAG: hypothetical protein JWO62_1433 [Acidimicrobiaceae bacterium]|nr:hypothetical protein [Acidimicrobiaceae bacterium]
MTEFPLQSSYYLDALPVNKIDRPATATLYLPSTVFVRVAGGRADARSGVDTIRLDGDLDLGRRVLENLAFTICILRGADEIGESDSSLWVLLGPPASVESDEIGSCLWS